MAKLDEDPIEFALAFVAALRKRTDLRPDVAALDGVAVGEAWTVGALALLESDPSRRGTPSGPYHLVAPLPLRG